MSTESYPLADGSSGEPYIREESQALLNELETLHDDPHGTLIAIQEGMQIDIASSMDFNGWQVIKKPESFRSEQLLPEQYESIKSFENIVTVFLRHGSLSPRQLGLWFSMPNADLDNWTPLHKLSLTAHDTGEFNKESVKQVARSATSFVSPAAGGDTAVWALWRD